MNKGKEIRKKIVNFVKRQYDKAGIVPSAREIEKGFNIYFKSYFPDGIDTLYQLCGFKFSPEQNRSWSIKKRWEEIKGQKKKEIIEFLKTEYKKSGIIPSGRQIYKKFKVDIWSYFKGGLREVYRICGFKFSPEENKQKTLKKIYLRKRNKIRKEILQYFIQQIKNGINPTTTSIREKFSGSILTYFPGGIRALYKITKINPPFPLRNREKLQKEIIQYIQSQVKRGFYPTYCEIEKRFHTNIRDFGSIKDLYQLAGVEYKRDPNPFLRYKKEKKLADIVLKLLPKLGYKVKRISIGPSKPNGADIIVEDNKKQLIPVEIKAFQKFGKIGQAKNSPYIRNEILQLKRYIKDLHAPYGYLITSTDNKTFKALPPNIKILFGKELKKLLLEYKMHKELRNLVWIRNSSISYGKEEMYEKIRNKILSFVKKELRKGQYVSNDKIYQKFRVHGESYFSGGMKEIYRKFNLDAELIPNYRMSRNFDKEKFKRGIINFVKEENKKGRLPTYKEIQRKFRCLPKLYFSGGIREIAKFAGIKYNRKFATKTPEEKELIRQQILKYTKKKLQKGYYPGYRDFRKDLLVGPLNYFSSIKEIHQKANMMTL